MDKRKLKTTIVKKESFCEDNNTQDFSLGDSDTEIRLGIRIADEKAKQENKIRKSKAPLSTEEKIFLGKL